ncbi:MAG: hypothetical protein ACK5MQ_17255 [Pikeienuella sp.]
MAEGRCPRRFHLSSLDPGVGKTSLSVAFVNRLLASPAHDGVAVLVCLSRLVEVESFVEQLRGVHDQVAVHTSDDGLNALTMTPAARARVLITTHQMIERRCQNRRFAEAETFHHEGLPREVRIWDEAMLPGDVVTLSSDQLAALRGPCRKLHPGTAEAVEALEAALRSCDHGATFETPVLVGASASCLTALTQEANGQTAETASALLYLSGRKVAISRSHHGVISALDYRDALPADLAPAVILDASGRVRHTYRLQERHRGDLVRLRAAPKDYAKLRVHVWDRGGGKASWGRDGEDLLRGIVAAIDGKPDEPWLVIHHKDCLSGRLPQRVRSLARGAGDRLRFIHWGAHHGINDHADVPNVILAGTLFLPAPIYEGRARLAADMRLGQPLPDGELEALIRGVHADAVLQGLSRAGVRLSIGGGFAPCEAWIIASPRSGIRKLLPAIFPGCRVERWRPVRKAPTGRVAEAIEVLERHLAASPDAPLMLADLRKRLGIDSPSNFRRAIRRHPDFIEALDELGLEEAAIDGARHANAIARVSALFPPVDDDDRDGVWRC